MDNRNIEYRSRQISQFYSTNRQRWSELYPSERWVFEKIASKRKSMGDVLDVGCACGGLAAALNEKFAVDSYTGIDINGDAIKWAKKNMNLKIPSTFHHGDFLKSALRKKFDLVVSLSCADWNIETERIVHACWKRVREESYFVISLRLTPGKGTNDISKSYQYINFSGDAANPEKANYVVFNFADAIRMFKELDPAPELIGAYGYWGIPSATSVTLYDKLVFAVLYIKKSKAAVEDTRMEFNLPLNILL